MKRQHFGDSAAPQEEAKEFLPEEEEEWEWEENPQIEKIRKKKGRADEGRRTARGREGGRRRT